MDKEKLRNEIGLLSVGALGWLGHDLEVLSKDKVRGEGTGQGHKERPAQG